MYKQWTSQSLLSTVCEQPAFFLSHLPCPSCHLSTSHSKEFCGRTWRQGQATAGDPALRELRMCLGFKDQLSGSPSNGISEQNPSLPLAPKPVPTVCLLPSVPQLAQLPLYQKPSSSSSELTPVATPLAAPLHR